MEPRSITADFPPLSRHRHSDGLKGLNYLSGPVLASMFSTFARALSPVLPPFTFYVIMKMETSRKRSERKFILKFSARPFHNLCRTVKAKSFLKRISLWAYLKGF